MKKTETRRKSLKFLKTLTSSNEKSFDYLHILPEESFYDYDAIKNIAEDSQEPKFTVFKNNIFSNYIDDNILIIKEFRISKELYGICVIIAELPDDGKWFSIPYFTLGSVDIDKYLGEIKVKNNLCISLLFPPYHLDFYSMPDFFKDKNKKNIAIFQSYMREKIKKLSSKILIKLGNVKCKLYKIVSTRDLKGSYITKGLELGIFIKVKPLIKNDFYKTKHDWNI
jgi:hypothetical protein